MDGARLLKSTWKLTGTFGPEVQNLKSEEQLVGMVPSSTSFHRALSTIKNLEIRVSDVSVVCSIVNFSRILGQNVLHLLVFFFIFFRIPAPPSPAVVLHKNKLNEMLFFLK